MQTFSLGNLVRRRWTVIVTVLVVALVAFTVDRLHGIFGSHNAVSRPSADSLENTGYNPKRVLFEVFGSPGSVATINYLDGHPRAVMIAGLARSRDPEMGIDSLGAGGVVQRQTPKKVVVSKAAIKGWAARRTKTTSAA
jgi:hypothetical protein